MQRKFIYETTNNRTQRLFALCIILLLAVVGIVFWVENASQTTNNERWYEPYVPDVVHNMTTTKLFVIGFLSGTILFPLPIELAFFFGIKQGANPILTTAAVIIGVTLGNAVSYWMGLKLSKQVSYLLSAKSLYGARRQVNKYGAAAILVMNLIPAPSDLLSFGLGMIRYNAKRLFTLLVIGTLIKYTIIATAVTFFL